LTRSRKIIFPLEFIFTDRDYSRLGIELLECRGLRVEVWDFSPLFKPVYFRNNQQLTSKSIITIKEIHTKKQAYSLLSKLHDDDVVMSISSISSDNYFFYKEINKRNIFLGFFQGAFLPQLSNEKFFFESIVFNLNHRLIGKAFHKINSNLKNYFQSKIEADFIVTIGLKHQKEASNIFHISDKYSLIKSHSLDFDKYLRSEQQKQKKIKNTIESEFIVFLDEAVTHHSDYDHSGTDPDCDEKFYYEEINNFFDQIEIEMGYEVVIAAHPKSEYKNKGDLFNNRKIIYGKTVELVSNSKLVLLHASTSVNFAIIYRKPLIYLTSLSYSSEFRRKINLRASKLNLTPITLPLNEKESINYSSNFEKYEDYFKSYIKYPGSSNKLFWDTVCDYLDK